jgi:hypothetical protein
MEKNEFCSLMKLLLAISNPNINCGSLLVPDFPLYLIGRMKLNYDKEEETTDLVRKPK